MSAIRTQYKEHFTRSRMLIAYRKTREALVEQELLVQTSRALASRLFAVSRWC